MGAGDYNIFCCPSYGSFLLSTTIALNFFASPPLPSTSIHFQFQRCLTGKAQGMQIGLSFEGKVTRSSAAINQIEEDLCPPPFVIFINLKFHPCHFGLGFHLFSIYNYINEELKTTNLLWT